MTGSAYIPYVCIILNKWFTRKQVSANYGPKISLSTLLLNSKASPFMLVQQSKGLILENDGHMTVMSSSDRVFAGSVISSNSSKMYWNYQMELRTRR